MHGLLAKRTLYTLVNVLQFPTTNLFTLAQVYKFN